MTVHPKIDRATKEKREAAPTNSLVHRRPTRILERVHQATLTVDEGQRRHLIPGMTVAVVARFTANGEPVDPPDVRLTIGRAETIEHVGMTREGPGLYAYALRTRPGYHALRVQSGGESATAATTHLHVAKR